MNSTEHVQRRYSEEMRLSDLVENDYRFSMIFERYGLNYCCKGARTLAQACAENGIDAAALLAELSKVADEPAVRRPITAEASLRETFSRLFEEYEPKLQAMILPVEARLQKVSRSHGASFPQTIAAAEEMDQLSDELLVHLRRGKEVLMPLVEGILRQRDEEDQEAQDAVRASVARVEHLAHELKTENRIIQRNLAEVRDLTSHYKVPEGVCTTFSVSYRELAEFDRTLSDFLILEEDGLLPRLFREPDYWE